MSRLLKVELRKLRIRKELYVCTVLMIIFTIFLMYQLTGNGTIITMESTEPAQLTLTIIFETIVSMSNYIGLFAIIIAILCWSSIGKEIDGKVMTTYVLHSENSFKLIMSKMIVISIALFSLLLLMAATFIISYYLFPSDQISFSNSVEDYQTFFKLIGITMLGGLFYLSFAVFLSLKWGTIGVLIGTVGFSIFSSILQSQRYIKEFLPLNLMEINEFKNVWLLISYISMILVLIKWIANRREVFS